MASFIKCDICGKLMPEVPSYSEARPDYHRIEFDGGRYHFVPVTSGETLEEKLNSLETGITIDACDKCFKKIKSSIDILKKGGN